MKPPTEAELLILTLLAEEPRSGQDLDRVVRERRLRDWTPLGRAGLYYLLGALRRRRWIAARREASAKGPPRRVCRVTPAGRAALAAGVRRALETAAEAPFAVDLAVMNASRVALAPLLREYARLVAGRLRETRARLRFLGPAFPLIPRLIFERHAAALAAELRWARRASASLARRIAR
jgi:DNA-binding PadR family transcriptional regulator